MKRIAVWICICTLILSGCGLMPKEVLIEKSTIPTDENITFMVPWPETTARGMKLKNIISNYNLTYPDKAPVMLLYGTDVESYEKEIRRLTAVNQLPDLLIIERNEHGRNIIGSGKLMDMSPYVDDIRYEEHAVSEEDFVNHQLMSIAFEWPALRFYYDQEAVGEYGYPFVSDSASLLYKLFGFMEESGEAVQRHQIGNARGALDFLFYLTTQQEDENYADPLMWQRCLEEWNRYYRFMDYEEEADKLIKGRADYPTGFFHDSTFFIEEEGLGSVLLLDTGGRVLRTAPLCLAAAGQSSREKEEQVVDFLAYVLSLSWTEDISTDAQNEFEDSGLREDRLLESSNLTTAVRRELLEVLQQQLAGEIDEKEAAGELVWIFEQSGEQR